MSVVPVMEVTQASWRRAVTGSGGHDCGAIRTRPLSEGLNYLAAFFFGAAFGAAFFVPQPLPHLAIGPSNVSDVD